MDKFMANANIAHFRKQLAEETDEAKRLMLVRLLAEEERKMWGCRPPVNESDVRTADPTAASVSGVG
jgi:hypothetical protein